jgi:hypothetical protein
MVRIDRLREDSEKRTLRCSEGKSIWYQIWIDPGRYDENRTFIRRR